MANQLLQRLEEVLRSVAAAAEAEGEARGAATATAAAPEPARATCELALENAEPLLAAVAELRSSPSLRADLGRNPVFWPLVASAIHAATVLLERHAPEDRVDGELLVLPVPAEQAAEVSTLLARLVRNAVAAVPRNQHDASLSATPAELERLLLVCSATGQRQTRFATTIRACTQALANILTANPEVQSRMWPAYLRQAAPGEDVLRVVLSSRDPAIFGSGLMLLHNCICNQEHNARILVRERPDLVHLLLDRAPNMPSDGDSDNFEFVYRIMRRFLELGHFADVYRNISVRTAADKASPPTTVTKSQLSLLRFLDLHLSQQHSPSECVSNQTATELAVIFRTLVASCASAMRAAAGELAADGGGCGAAEKLGRPEDYPSHLDALESAERESALFTALIIVLECLGTVTMDSSEALVSAVINAGAVGCAINLLACAHATLPRATKASIDIGKANNIPSGMSVLRGLKRGLVRMIGNLACGRAAVQDEVREKGGLGLVLELCNVDDNNPYIREYALVAVRHLLENNEANQTIVRELRPLAPAQHPALQEIGLETRLDADGKARVGIPDRR